MTPPVVLKTSLAQQAFAGAEAQEGTDPLGDVPDLSVGREYQILLARTGRSAVVDITFKTATARHHAYYRGIGEKLTGRTELISISDDNLLIDFQVEDSSAESFALVRRFAEALHKVLGDDVAQVEVRINELNPEVVAVLLDDERARLRAI